MKTKKQLEQLTEAIGNAIFAYRKAIKENNLQEIGHPVCVQGDNSEELGITVSVIDDDTLAVCTIDQIKYDKEHDDILVHYSKYNYKETDEWNSLSCLGDADDYVLEAVQWICRENVKVVDGGTHQGLSNDIWSFASQSLYFIHADGRIENVDCHQGGIDDFIGVEGEFCVLKEDYEDAVKEVEEHYREA